MIYGLLAFFMVLAAALGGVLYARSGDLVWMRHSIQNNGASIENLSRENREFRAAMVNLERGNVNAPDTEALAARIVALERAREDIKRPAVVRGINEARRLATQMGGVEGISQEKAS